ncbi:MAG TPA: O-antigen ligase family protein [Thermoanaerobaculia bacterium]|nr:O-antigen ligase family protein [Thermoanaerobaculia bacterium]
MAPFPYGAITRGGTLTLEILAFATTAATFVGRPRLAPLAGVWIPISAILAIILLGVAQVIPLPDSALWRISPVSAQIYGDAARVLGLFRHAAPAARISIAPAETIDTILLTSSYLSLFVSSALLLRTRRRRRLFVAVLLGGAALHVLIATVTSDETSAGRLHGAFVNSNHFAGYLQIMLAVAFGALWREVLFSRDRGRQLPEPTKRLETRLLHIAPLVLLWAIFAAAIALTKSRGGILVASVSTAVMLSAALSHRRIRNRRLSIAVAGGATIAAGASVVILAVRQQPILRFLASDPRDPGSDLRLTLWRLSIDAWRQFPLAGSGLGTYREAFRRIQPRGFDYYVEFAHSDPLQLLVTGGLAGFILGAIAFAALSIALASSWRREEHREESAFLLAGIGALFALTLHGLVEFNMSIPAIPATLAAVLGFAWTAGAHEKAERAEKLTAPVAAPPVGG